jgi:hypothetical protein
MQELLEKPVETEFLVCRAQGGDRQAFDSLVERYRERLGTMIRSHLTSNLRQTVEVEELTEETMVRAFRSLERFRWRGQDSSYEPCANLNVILARRRAFTIPTAGGSSGTAPNGFTEYAQAVRGSSRTESHPQLVFC